MLFYSHSDKTHFHKKGVALSLVLKARYFGTQKWHIIVGLDIMFRVFRSKHNRGKGDVQSYCHFQSTKQRLRKILSHSTELSCMESLLEI